MDKLIEAEKQHQAEKKQFLVEKQQLLQQLQVQVQQVQKSPIKNQQATLDAAVKTIRRSGLYGKTNG
jgi:hypothetical protein